MPSFMSAQNDLVDFRLSDNFGWSVKMWFFFLFGKNETEGKKDFISILFQCPCVSVLIRGRSKLSDELKCKSDFMPVATSIVRFFSIHFSIGRAAMVVVAVLTIFYDSIFFALSLRLVSCVCVCACIFRGWCYQNPLDKCVWSTPISVLRK